MFILGGTLHGYMYQLKHILHRLYMTSRPTTSLLTGVYYIYMHMCTYMYVQCTRIVPFLWVCGYVCLALCFA